MENNNNSKKKLSFSYLTNPDREDKYFPELGFSKSDFEDLCKNFNPEEEIMLGLAVNRQQLDKMCMEEYNQPFHETWLQLSGAGKMLMRRVYNNLAKSGNASAMTIQQTYLNLATQNNSSGPIQIVLDINKREENK